MNSAPSNKPLILSVLAFLLILAGVLILRQFVESPGGSAGARLYKVHCENCHMADGKGLRQLIPPLADSDMLKALGPSVACIIRNGQEGEIIVNGRTFNQPMPGNQNLTDPEILLIVQFINAAWGNEGIKTNLKEVQNALNGCP
jgi:mono/diheme cytochrome c family protein